MKFLELTAENFFRIREPVHWPLADQGLVLITGDNQDSTRADSNGAGKSTLFEALLWVLWGKTFRGQTADEVVNNTVKKNCKVEILLEEKPGDVRVITRYRKHKRFGNLLEFGVKGDPTGRS